MAHLQRGCQGSSIELTSYSVWGFMNQRMAVIADVPGACRILNDIIQIGGTTAYEDQLSEAHFTEHFLTGESSVSCIVCEDDNGTILGFQSLVINSKLPVGWVDIATFARAESKVRGVGAALFAASKLLLRNQVLASQYRMINATIRADNKPGLSYYNKMGFVDYHCEKSVPLKDGTPVDRIYKQYKLVQ